MFPPPYRRLAGDWGSSAASLVVVDQLAADPQRVEVRQEIIVVCAGSSVEDHSRWALAYPALE
jgi:streptomycin 6-kinase